MISMLKPDGSSDVRERTIHLSEEEMKAIDKGIYGEFRRVITARINEEAFVPMFIRHGRPSIPVCILVAIPILAMALRITENQILTLLKFHDPALMYALCLDDRTDLIPSKRTLIRFRIRCIWHRLMTGEDIFHEMAVSITRSLAEQLKIGQSYFRMDSVMLNVYAQPLSRSQMLYHANQGVVLSVAEVSKNALYQNERQAHPKLDDVFDPERAEVSSEAEKSLAKKLVEEKNIPVQLAHYLEIGDFNRTFYSAKNTSEKIATILGDAVLLWRLYKDKLADNEAFQLFVRVMNEQCEWVTQFEKTPEGEECTQSGKKTLRFKLSKEERRLQKKSAKELEHLEDVADACRKKWEKIEGKANKVADDATATEEEAQKQENTKKAETLRKKVAKLGAKLGDLATEAQSLREDYDKAMGNLNAEFVRIGEESVYVVTDESMEHEVEAMNSSILQTLNDPEATCAYKAGGIFRGYKACAVEMADDLGHSMPVEWSTDQNNVSDSAMGAGVIRAMKGFLSERMKHLFVTDAGFFGNEMTAAVEEANGILVTTDLSGRKAKPFQAENVFNNDGRLEKCAGGQSPKDSKVNDDGTVTSKVDASKCQKCKYYKDCNPSISGGTATMKTSQMQKAKALFQKAKGEMAYTIIGCFRNGIEALMSAIKRVAPVVRQPIYGYMKVSWYVDNSMVAVAFQKYIAQLGKADELGAVKATTYGSGDAAMSDFFPDTLQFKLDERLVRSDVKKVVSQNPTPDQNTPGGSKPEETTPAGETPSNPEKKPEELTPAGGTPSNPEKKLEELTTAGETPSNPEKKPEELTPAGEAPFYPDGVKYELMVIPQPEEGEKVNPEGTNEKHVPAQDNPAHTEENVENANGNASTGADVLNDPVEPTPVEINANVSTPSEFSETGTLNGTDKLNATPSGAGNLDVAATSNATVTSDNPHLGGRASSIPPLTHDGVEGFRINTDEQPKQDPERGKQTRVRGCARHRSGKKTAAGETAFQ